MDTNENDAQLKEHSKNIEKLNLNFFMVWHFYPTSLVG